MNLQTMRLRVASNINYLTAAGAVVTDRGVTSDDIDNWINDRYIEDVFPEFSVMRPEFFTRETTVQTYRATGTADASSTGSTLVSTAIFDNAMIGATVLNSTDDDTRLITGFTSDTTVTVDEAIDNDWDGDTIYVFDGMVVFGGGITDARQLQWVGVKYASADTDYTRVDISDYRDMFNSEKGTTHDTMFSSSDPKYYFDTVSVASVQTSAIVIRPYPTVVITDGIYIKYVEKPATLTTSLEPRLPAGHHQFLVYGATADALRKINKFQEANEFEKQYQLGKRRLYKAYPAERKKRTVDFTSYYNEQR